MYILHSTPKNTVIFNTDGEAAAARQSTTAATPESSKEDNIPTVVSAEAKSKAKNTSPSKTTLGLSLVPAFIFAC